PTPLRERYFEIPHGLSACEVKSDLQLSLRRNRSYSFRRVSGHESGGKRDGAENDGKEFGRYRNRREKRQEQQNRRIHDGCCGTTVHEGRVIGERQPANSAR